LALPWIATEAVEWSSYQSQSLIKLPQDTTNMAIAKDISEAIYLSYEQEFNGEFRPHLGASMGGDPCLRKLWYSFRWVKQVNFNGRMLKLFQRGHREEDFFIEDLKRAGINIINQDENGYQYRFSSPHNAHIGGSGDGFGEVLTDQFLELKQGIWVLVEMKTHSEKSFTKLVKEGVRTSKPLHYSQTQLYMGWSQLSQAVYIAVNKNTDELHIEIVNFDQAEFERVEGNMIKVVQSISVPDRLHTDPSRFECKYCDYNDVCHTSTFNLNVTCRNCVYGFPNNDGTWTCKLNDTLLNDFRACDNHIFSLDILDSVLEPIGVSHTDDNYYFMEYKTLHGEVIVNGNPSKVKGGLTSFHIARDIAGGKYEA
jgi:CRISPR/Cas system-associated exonuclease Cas4 (RecB family)